MPDRTCKYHVVHPGPGADIAVLVQRAFDECRGSTEADINKDLNNITLDDGGLPVYPRLSPALTALTALGDPGGSDVESGEIESTRASEVALGDFCGCR